MFPIFSLLTIFGNVPNFSQTSRRV